MFELQSLADMSNPDNRNDALHAYDRCVTDSDYAAWAKQYGRLLASVRHLSSAPTYKPPSHAYYQAPKKTRK